MIDKLENILKSAGEETFKHCVNVQKITEILLHNEMLKDKFTEQQKQDIINGARYHDVGKALIDKDVLYAQRRLTDQEFALIKQHPVLGTQILFNNQAELNGVLDSDKQNQERAEVFKNICQHHHTRPDGGYPPLEEGQVLPDYVEIVGLADVFEALTAKRSYKEPMSVQEAHDLIMQGKCGGKFSPEIESLFENSLKDLETYVDKSRNPSITEFVTQKKEMMDIEEKQIAEKNKEDEIEK